MMCLSVLICVLEEVGGGGVGGGLYPGSFNVGYFTEFVTDWSSQVITKRSNIVQDPGIRAKVGQNHAARTAPSQRLSSH